MRTSQIGTLTAAFFGAGIGVVFALSQMSRQPAVPPAAEPPYRPVSQQVAAPTTAPSVVADPTPDPEAPPSPADLALGVDTAPTTAPHEPTAALEDLEPTTALPDPLDPANRALAPTRALIMKDAQWCARGMPDRCVRVARFYEEGTGVRRDPDRALKFLKLAVEMYATRCRQRDARSCYKLSRLYDRGRGVPRNPKVGAALVERTRELCRSNQSAFCDAPDAPDAVRIR